MNNLPLKAKKLFLDSLKITVRGGKGGHGLPHYGGIGGKGGDVYIEGSSRMRSLRSLKLSNFVAGDGEPARRTKLLGGAGRDLVINVPVGVTVEDSHKQLLGDINKPTDRVIVAMGGRGGDKYNDNHGFVGQCRLIKLDLKLISDAVLVGFPNAGKSTLLTKLSKATPKVADYPFTTLTPNLGVINYNDYRQITVADLPGLVEGAHKNLGLGQEFMKHIVRTKLLIFLIDVNNCDLGPSYARRSPLETISILNKEIELYDDTILKKPAILAVSKMDSLSNSDEIFTKLKDDLNAIYQDSTALNGIEESIRPSRLIHFDEILHLSSKTSLNINLLKDVCRSVIDKYAELEKQETDGPSSYRELQAIENNRLIV